MSEPNWGPGFIEQCFGKRASPDLIQPQVEAESVDTPEFIKVLGAYSDACGNHRLEDEWMSARSALIAHIDSIITARVAAARQAALEDATTIVEGRFTGMIAHDLRLVHIADAIRALAASQAAPAKAGQRDATDGGLRQALEGCVEFLARIDTIRHIAPEFEVLDKAKSVLAATGTVYVCPEKDIECGRNADNWCGTCPKRSPSTPAKEPT